MSRPRGDSIVDELEHQIATSYPHFHLDSNERALPNPDGTVTETMDAVDVLEAMTPSQPQIDHDSEEGSSSKSSREAQLQPSPPPPPDPERSTQSTEFAYPTIDEMMYEKTAEGKVLPDVFIQQRNSFKRVKREKFESMLAEKADNGSAIVERHFAYSLQSSFHNVSLIMQGFLSGLTTAHAVFACNFADMELLFKGYRWMSLPVHVTFYLCFVLGAVSAFDRLVATGGGWRGLISSLRVQNGGLPVILWLLGTIASVLTIRFDESLAPSVINHSLELPYNALFWWRVLSCARAVCALLCWLLLAMQPDANYLRDRLAEFHLTDEQRGYD